MSVMVIDDIVKYFEDNGYVFSVLDNDHLVAHNDVDDVDIKVEDIDFDVTVSAVSDKSDNETGVTSDPVKFISDFIKAPENKSLASNPGLLASKLRKLSTIINDVILLRELRRIGCALSRNIKKIASESTTGEGIKEFEKIREEMAKKHWDVYEDNKKLIVNIHDRFESTISIKTIEYKYNFHLQGMPDFTDKAGVTINPVNEFIRYGHVDYIKAQRKKKRTNYFFD